MRRFACLCSVAVAFAFTLPGVVRADPDKDESGKQREKRDEKAREARDAKGGDKRDDKGRERRDEKGREGGKEWEKDVAEANGELRKAEAERDRELDNARAEAEREDKPEKFDEKREKIWGKFREKESKIRGKLDEKHGRAYERDYDGPRDAYRRFPDDADDRPDRAPAGGDADERGDDGAWVKLADCPPEARRVINRERGQRELKKIRQSRLDGREIYRAVIIDRNGDRVIVVTAKGRLIDEYRLADVRPKR